MLGRKETFPQEHPNTADPPRLWFFALQFHFFALELLSQSPLLRCRSIVSLQSQ